MKVLEGLGWSPKWVSHLGCLKGCLVYLGIDVTDGWLFGATGHAFVLNIHDELCPSGPTAWRAEPIHRLGRNVGYSPSCVFGFKQQDDFRAKQELAWQDTRAAIDAGVPCFGWELAIPEYYVVYGYDDAGYLYKGAGCDDGAGPKAWSELGDTGIGVLEMYTIRPAAGADDDSLVRQALEFALAFGRDPAPWTFDGYTAGLAGYGVWISALKRNSANGMGAAYNAAVWSECRTNAAQFLAEAAGRLPPAALHLCTTARERYQAVADSLQAVAEEFPFVHGSGDTDGEEAMRANVADGARRARAIDALRAAQSAEEAGLGAVEVLLADLT
jgi:hypothetical protein